MDGEHRPRREPSLHQPELRSPAAGAFLPVRGKSVRDGKTFVWGGQNPVRDVPNTLGPRPVAGPPQNFSVTQGDHGGEVDGHCDAQMALRGNTVAGGDASAPAQ
jgi:hypothetical protein